MVIFQNKLERFVRLTTEQEISICTHNQTPELLSSNTGLKQDAVAPLLFNIALIMTFQQTQWNLIGMKYNNKHTVLSYADDIAILSQSKAHKGDF